MKKIVTVLLGLLIAFQVTATKRRPPSCNGEAYSSQVVKTQVISETCVRYEIKVSYDGTRTYGLSHYSIAIPCGEIKDATNSEGWKMVFGKDPKTGVYGLKVDDINGFGERRSDTFTVSFTWCSSSSCAKDLGVVAYKFGQCVSYDTLSRPSDPEPPQNCSSLLGSLKKVNPTCAGQTEGRLEVVIQEGTAPYTYAWSNGAKTAAIDNLAAGSYAVTVKDAKGNVLTLKGDVVAPPPIVISESVVNPSCSGQYNGAINLEVSGGTGAYSFAWSNGATTQNITDLPSGFYTITVTDSIGCSAVKAMVLTNGTLLSAEANLTHPTCTATNGAIDLTPIGGAAPYSYQWSNGATTEDLADVGAGTYIVTITDAGGCFSFKSYTLEVRSPLLIQYVVTPTSCGGDNSGAIDLIVSGGTEPYSIVWTDGVTTEDRSNLTVGGYQVNVSDAAGCSGTSAIFVNNQTLEVVSNVIQPTCAGGSGSISVTPVGGSGPYTYEWSNGQTGNSIGNLTPGNYTVNVTDAAGCSVFQSFFIVNPDALLASGTVSNTQCGAANGFAIDLSVSGGKFPYTYRWSNGATSEDVSGLAAGTYSVEVKDDGGCVVNRQFVVDATSLNWSCLINPVAAPVVCGSVGNYLSTAVTGATSYQWSISSTDPGWTITSASTDSTIVYSAGGPGSTATFTVVIVKNGCTQTCSYTVTGGCVQRDNTGGGDPSSGEPCVPAAPTPTPTTPPVTTPTTPPAEQPREDDSRYCGRTMMVTAYPNPFRDKVKLEWTAKSTDRAKLEIYDSRGRLLEVLFEGRTEAGRKYAFEWAPDAGREFLYYFKLSTSKGVEHGKLVKR